MGTNGSPPGSADGDDRKRQKRGVRRRQQILDAAVELFAANGYRGTGVAALADRVGMTPTGLLYYFGTKERLLREVVAERDRADSVDSLDDLSLSSLRELGRHNMETAVLTRLYAVLGAENLDPQEPLHGFFVERYETARSFARDILQLDVASGRLRADIDVDQLALEVVATLMGLELQWLADPERIDLSRAVEGYIDRLVIELAPSGT